MMTPPQWRLAIAFACAAVSPLNAADIDIEGVQAAAIEMPHTVAMLRRPAPPTPPDQIIPLNVEVEDFFDPDITVHEYAFEAFLDTGTSGVLISREFYEFLGVQQHLDSNNNPVSFFDVTVDGEKEFHVSEPLYISIAPSPLFPEPAYDDMAGINAVFTPPTLVRAQLAVDNIDLGAIGAQPRNVVGMPALLGKVVKVDSRGYNYYNPDPDADPDEIELPSLLTTIHQPGDPAIPVADHTIRLSFGDFSNYTRVSPIEPGVEGPTLAHNPFIGADPTATTPAPDAPPGVTIRRDNAANPLSPFSSTGNWLLDTGAQISFMSSIQALALDVEIVELIDGISVLQDRSTGELIADQFFIPISGADAGSIAFLPGFTLDELVLPSLEGNITYHDVPVLVVDVWLEDALGNTLLLDGDIGMNLFLPSMNADGENAVTSSFDYLVFDEPSGQLRLTLTVPEPATASIMVIGAMFVLRRRRSL
jgi:hypothetical protein